MAVTITHVNTTPGPGNKVTAANWTAGHVITGGLQSVTVTIPSADILTLHTTPVELVPAPGAGKAISVHQVTVFLTGVTSAYVQADNDVRVMIGLWTYQYVASLVGQTNDAFGTFTKESFIADLDTVEDVPVVLKATDGNPTDGDGDLTITVYYTVEDVPA